MTTPRSRLWLLFAGCTSFNVPLFWAKNPPLEWSSNSAGALFNPTLHNRLRHFDIHRKSFSWIPHMPTFYSCGLVVEVTVDSKDNEAEKTREVADIYISHISLQLEFSSKKMWWTKAMLLGIKVFHIFDMSDNIKYMGNGGQWHCRRQAQHGEEDYQIWQKRPLLMAESLSSL